MEDMRPYRIVSFTTSNQDDEQQWFNLELQLHTVRFRIWISPSKWRNSPTRLEEFRKYLAVLSYENDIDYDSMEEDCFDWAVTPCLAQFKRLSPPLPPLDAGNLTLSHFLSSAFLECHLTAVDDVLAPGEIGPFKLDPDMRTSDQPTPKEPWTTSFPSFSPAEVFVICDGDPKHLLNSTPTQVRIGEQLLTFKEAMGLDDDATKKEVETYERIAAAGFGPDVRTPRLYGVVQNGEGQLLGMLLYPIEEETALRYALGPETPDAVKERWAQQIKHTLAALHGAGIVWGDAKRDNVRIDVHGHAWITGFIGGINERGEVEGDQQDLEQILASISNHCGW